MLWPLLFIALVDAPMAPTDRLMAGAAWALCLLPAWLYLGVPDRCRSPIPFFPFIGLEFALYYALQGVIGGTNVYGRFDVERMGAVLTPEMYSTPIWLVFTGWSLLLFGYYVVGVLFPSRRPKAHWEWDPRSLARWGFRILLLGLAIEILQRIIGNPLLIRGLLYFGGVLSLLALSLLTFLSVRRQLNRAQNLAFFASAALLMFLRAGTSATSQLVVVTLAILFAVWAAGGRLAARWIWLGALAAIFFVSIRGVANEHRKTEEFVRGELSLVERSTLLFVLLAERVEREGVVATVAGGWETVSARAALLDLMTDVMRQTPEAVPYWNGETYKSLIGAFVPRFLWPDKPVKITGYAFGHRYGYLAQNDYSTTINLPFFIEFYANFGVLGVYLGMLFVGVIFRILDRTVNVPGQSVLRTVVGMGLLLPLTNIESDFSLVFGGLFLTGAALYGVYRIANTAVVRRRLALPRRIPLTRPTSEFPAAASTAVRAPGLR